MNHKILLIEDTEDLGEIIVDILTKEGFQTYWASDPLVGLELFSKIHPEVVITDLVMGPIDGLEVIRKIRSDKELALIPIIVLSAKASPEDEKISYETGANIHLRKPCGSDQLVYAINSVL